MTVYKMREGKERDEYIRVKVNLDVFFSVGLRRRNDYGLVQCTMEKTYTNVKYKANNEDSRTLQGLYTMETRGEKKTRGTNCLLTIISININNI